MADDDIKIEPSKRTLAARLRGYLIAGILVTAPLGITVWLTITFIRFIDTSVINAIPPQYSPLNYLPISIPGLGLIIMLTMLILIGMLTANFLGRYIVRLGEYLLDRMPIVRSLYGGIKQILETVLATQSNAFREVVLMQYPRKGVWSVGFITGRTQGQIQDLTKKETVNVFVPTTPNPTSGYLLFVPRDELHVLDMTVEEGIKLVVSAGIVTPLPKKNSA